MSKFIPLIVNSNGVPPNGTPYRVETTRQYAPFYAFGTFDGATVTLEWATEIGGVYVPFIADGAPVATTIPIDLIALKLPQNLYIRTNVGTPGAGTSITFGYFDG